MIDFGNFVSIHLGRFRSRLGMWRVGIDDQTKCRGTLKNKMFNIIFHDNDSTNNLMIIYNFGHGGKVLTNPRNQDTRKPQDTQNSQG